MSTVVLYTDTQNSRLKSFVSFVPCSQSEFKEIKLGELTMAQLACLYNRTSPDSTDWPTSALFFKKRQPLFTVVITAISHFGRLRCHGRREWEKRNLTYGTRSQHKNPSLRYIGEFLWIPHVSIWFLRVDQLFLVCVLSSPFRQSHGAKQIVIIHHHVWSTHNMLMKVSCRWAC